VSSVNPDLSHPNQASLPTGGGLVEGFTLSLPLRERLARRIGRELPPEVWAYHPQGFRLLVAPEPVSERVGLLWKPRTTIDRQKLQAGAGWVIAVGPLVGSGGNTLAGSVLCPHPSVLLGHHVLFKMYSGTDLRISEEEEEFSGSLLMLTDRDILAVGEML